MAYSLLLPIHSITMNTSRRTATTPTLGKSEKAGTLNNDGENISEMYEKACCIFSEKYPCQYSKPKSRKNLYKFLKRR